jgi:hypothetical protein
MARGFLVSNFLYFINVIAERMADNPDPKSFSEQFSRGARPFSNPANMYGRRFLGGFQDQVPSSSKSGKQLQSPKRREL